MTIIRSIKDNKEELTHPINAFPDYFQEIINHYSEVKGYPHEYFITASMSALSTAMGRSITLNTGNFTAIPCIWAIILGKRGFTKSEPLEDAFKPIINWQFELKKYYDAQNTEREEIMANNPKSKVPEIPNYQRIILSDTTPESLVISLAENPKGCGIIYDELAGFIGRFDRYNSGADEQMYLSLFNGSSIIRDRVNSKTNAYAKKSYLSIVGTTQPGVLKQAFSGKTESGFFDRWLITNPEKVSKQYPNSFGIDRNIESNYSKIIATLLALPYDEHRSKMEYLDSSKEIISAAQHSFIDQENDTPDDNLRGILAKMEIYLHRFALLLQMLKYGIENDPGELNYVSDESAKGAVILAEYFIDQAKKVRLLSPVETLKDQWVDIYKALPDNGKNFNRIHFIKVCATFGIGERRADSFLKENADRGEDKLFFKVKHGEYTKNIF